MLAKPIHAIVAFGAIANVAMAFGQVVTPLSSQHLVVSSPLRAPKLDDDPIQWGLRRADPSLLQNGRAPGASNSDKTRSTGWLQRRRTEGRVDQVTFEQPVGTLGDLIGYDLAGYAVALLLAIPLPFLFRLRRAQYSAAQMAKRDEYLRQRIAEARLYSEPNRIPLGALDDRKI